MTALITFIPKDAVLAGLAALHAMSIAQLKQQWRGLLGNEPPPFNRTYVQSRLAYRIQENALTVASSLRRWRSRRPSASDWMAPTPSPATS